MMNYKGNQWQCADIRNYIIVLGSDGCTVQHIVISPIEGTVDDNNLYDALEYKWRDLANKYTWPNFDIMNARGHLQQIRNALPECSGWETARQENLMINQPTR
jgi:hypothetical protein